MKEFKCDKCNYTTNRKSNLLNHINRKKPCSSIKNNYVCNQCSKVFKSNTSIYRHEKICTINYKDQYETLLKTVKTLENKIQNISCAVQNTTNNSNNNINTTNIQQQNNIIVNFGSESMDKLTFEEKRKILLSAGRAHLEYLDLVHFNPRIPEFNNLFLTNLKSGICKISDKNKIKTTDYKTIESELVNNTADNIEKISYEFKEEYPDVKFREKVIKELLYLLQTVELEKEDRERRDNLLKELKYHLYDKSKELTKKS